MFRLFVIVLLCMWSVLAWAQSSPVTVGLDIQPTWFQTNTDFHAGQLSLTSKYTQFNVSATATSPGRFKFKYTLLPGSGHEDSIVDPVSLVVGSTDFSANTKNKASSSKSKVVSIDYKIPIGHRFVVSPDWRVAPVAVAEIAGFALEATGENKDGKVVTENESYKRIFLGLGAACGYSSGPVVVSLVGALGRDYRWVEGALGCKTYKGISVGGGYVYKFVKFPGDVAVDQRGPFLNISFLF